MYYEGGGPIKRNNNKFKSILYAWLCLIIVISIILGITYYKMQPVIIRYAESVAETVMLNSANDAVISILENENFSYNDIAILSNNTAGEITSLHIDTYKVNYLKSRISNEISDIIAGRERYTVSIPVGTFLGNTYFTGFGPDLNFKMQITTTAFVDFDHEFRSAGINQVLHKVLIDIKICGSLVVAGYKKSITVNTSAIAAQTVIVGVVPEGFTNVIEEETDNTAGLINDYGAVTGG
jgi:sporulation protein YunB